MEGTAREMPVAITPPADTCRNCGAHATGHFCPNCGCVTHWRSQIPEGGRRRVAVNVRLSEPDAVARLPIDHFEGLERFEDLPRDGRCVADYWF